MASSTGPGRRGTGLLYSALLLLVLTGLSVPVGTVSEPGKWILNLNSETLKKENFFIFTKTLFNSSFIQLKLVAETCNSSSPVKFDVSWYLRNSHCYNEFLSLNATWSKEYFNSKVVKQEGGSGYYVFHRYPTITCQPHMFHLDEFKMKTRLTELPRKLNTETKTSGTRRRREEEPPKPKAAVVQKKGASAETGKDAVPPKEVAAPAHFDAVAESWEDGPYMFILHIEEKNRAPDGANPPTPWSLQLQISMKGSYDYISATEWPNMVEEGGGEG
ncbi:transmembrane protein 87A [Cottoperca gobio]|uniref:Transmembrane protein 87A n=1 Tax=Cottoperca gobio TaxID=56716 RepID=A0A6J2QZ21_COTGO|nr:transmembrane protein 87A-like [Cottoperca gobio]